MQACGRGDRAGICVTQLDAKLVERGLACTPGGPPAAQLPSSVAPSSAGRVRRAGALLRAAIRPGPSPAWAPPRRPQAACPRLRRPWRLWRRSASTPARCGPAARCTSRWDLPRVSGAAARPSLGQGRGWPRGGRSAGQAAMHGDRRRHGEGMRVAGRAPCAARAGPAVQRRC